MAKAWIFFVAMLVLLPEPAIAQNLQCDQGYPIGSSSLFGVTTCSGLGPANVFSALNCQFQQILDEVMSRMYCGMQHHLMYTLAIAMTLFVIIYAIAFTFGIVELTAKELVTRLIKMALIWSFAMNASWGVGLAFNALVGSIEMASSWTVKLIDPRLHARNIFQYLDVLLFNQVSGQFTAYGAMLLGFILSLIWALFPLFALFLYLFVTVLRILVNVLVSYLMGLVLIAFLIALAPLFVSFALFQITFHFFETWLRYLISMALQIILILAAVSVWVIIMNNFGEFFTNLYSVMRISDFVVEGGSGQTVQRGVGVCESMMQYTLYGYRLQCVGNNVVPPTAFIQYPSFIWYLFSNVVTLCIITYAFSSLMRQLPQIAQRLAGPADTPKLYGLSNPSNSSFAGLTGLGKAQKLGQSSIVRVIQQALGDGNNDDRGGNATAQVRNQNATMVGGRN